MTHRETVRKTKRRNKARVCDDVRRQLPTMDQKRKEEEDEGTGSLVLVTHVNVR